MRNKTLRSVLLALLIIVAAFGSWFVFSLLLGGSSGAGSTEENARIWKAHQSIRDRINIH